MPNNYRVYQTLLPQIHVWELETAAEVAEAFAIITADKEHTYSIRWNLFSDPKPLDPRKFQLAADGESVVIDDWGDALTAIEIGSAIVTSSNGSAYINKPGRDDGESWPDYLTRPYTSPLP